MSQYNYEQQKWLNEREVMGIVGMGFALALLLLGALLVSLGSDEDVPVAPAVEAQQR